MPHEKQYTAKQATLAVLAKVSELLKKSNVIKSLEKSETGHEKGVHQSATGWAPYEHGTSRAGIISQMGNGPKTGAVKEHKRVLSEIKNMPAPKLPKSEDAQAEEKCKNCGKMHKKEEMDKCMSKAEPKGEIHPKEHMEGESEKPGTRIKAQKAPGNNPKEQAEGNNELAGTTPTQVGADGKNKPGYDEMKSHLKLAKWIGRMEHKRSLKGRM